MFKCIEESHLAGLGWGESDGRADKEGGNCELHLCNKIDNGGRNDVVVYKVISLRQI